MSLVSTLLHYLYAKPSAFPPSHGVPALSGEGAGKWKPLLICELEVFFSEELIFSPSETGDIYVTPQSVMKK